MSAVRRWLVIFAAWWAVVNLVSVPEHVRAIREGVTAGAVLAQVFLGFIHGPATADEYSVLGAVFLAAWPAYVVLLHKALSGRWGFREGVVPSLVAAVVPAVVIFALRVGSAVAYYAVPSGGMLVSAVPGYLDLALRLLVIATLANALSWPLEKMKKSTAGRLTSASS